MLRYNFNGSLDCTFGDGGVVITDFAEDSIAEAWGVAVQLDGKIVVVGRTDSTGHQAFGVARFEGESLGDADSDCDGLLDSTELDIAEGSECPNPFDFDSDDDLLGDGEEVALGTNPCDPDSDGDGVLDNEDPLPLDPGVTQDFLEQLTRDLCAAIQALDLALFTGQNDNAKAGRRNSLANRACLAANAIVDGQIPSAIALLQSLIEKIDGSDPDWMDDSPEKDSLAADVNLVILLLLTE